MPFRPISYQRKKEPPSSPCKRNRPEEKEYRGCAAGREKDRKGNVLELLGTASAKGATLRSTSST